MVAPVVSLFTREWIEIVFGYQKSTWLLSLPLYEGVDWNDTVKWHGAIILSLPLYEGVDWNAVIVRNQKNGVPVSLFTREWIEIERFVTATA